MKKSIDLSRILTGEPWISRRVRYPETTEAEYCGTKNICILGEHFFKDNGGPIRDFK
jgi:hypothetical protein